MIDDNTTLVDFNKVALGSIAMRVPLSWLRIFRVPFSVGYTHGYMRHHYRGYGTNPGELQLAPTCYLRTAETNVQKTPLGISINGYPSDTSPEYKALLRGLLTTMTVVNDIEIRFVPT